MAGKARKGQMGFVQTSKVVAEFVEEMPEFDNKANFRGKKAISWEPQEGSREAMLLAYQNPKRPMIFVEYTEGSPSKRRNNADLRARTLKNQGYSPAAGWIIKAVDAKVYVSYMGTPQDDDEDEGDIW